VRRTAPPDSCTWREANLGAHGQFAPERRNVGFFFVQDDTGVNVWAQWDTSMTDIVTALVASLLNVSMEMKCLFPRPDRIYYLMVDTTGDMQINGYWSWADALKMDVNKIMVLYMKGAK
jgi:hypothetical protein